MTKMGRTERRTRRKRRTPATERGDRAAVPHFFAIGNAMGIRVLLVEDEREIGDFAVPSVREKGLRPRLGRGLRRTAGTASARSHGMWSCSTGGCPARTATHSEQLLAKCERIENHLGMSEHLVFEEHQSHPELVHDTQWFNDMHEVRVRDQLGNFLMTEPFRRITWPMCVWLALVCLSFGCNRAAPSTAEKVPAGTSKVGRLSTAHLGRMDGVGRYDSTVARPRRPRHIPGRGPRHCRASKERREAHCGGAIGRER